MVLCTRFSDTLSSCLNDNVVVFVHSYIFMNQVDLDRSTMQPKFDPIEVRTYDLQLTADHDSTVHVTETPAL